MLADHRHVGKARWCPCTAAAAYRHEKTVAAHGVVVGCRFGAGDGREGTVRLLRRCG